MSLQKLSLIKKISAFFRDVWLELKRVKWPEPNDLAKFVGVVIIALLVCVFFLGAWDAILTKILQLFSPASPRGR